MEIEGPVGIRFTLPADSRLGLSCEDCVGDPSHFRVT
jgi:hypothetical protein